MNGTEHHECYHFECSRPATGVKVGKYTKVVFYACDEHRGLDSDDQEDS